MIYGIDGNDCYLGSPTRSENVISGPASQDLKMFMSKGEDELMCDTLTGLNYFTTQTTSTTT